jgi:hypothetical protein
MKLEIEIFGYVFGRCSYGIKKIPCSAVLEFGEKSISVIT